MLICPGRKRTAALPLRPWSARAPHLERRVRRCSPAANTCAPRPCAQSPDRCFPMLSPACLRQRLLGHLRTCHRGYAAAHNITISTVFIPSPARAPHPVATVPRPLIPNVFHRHRNGLSRTSRVASGCSCPPRSSGSMIGMLGRTLVRASRRQRRTHDRDLVARKAVAPQQQLGFSAPTTLRRPIIWALVSKHHRMAGTSTWRANKMCSRLRHRAVGRTHHQDRHPSAPPRVNIMFLM